MNEDRGYTLPQDIHPPVPLPEAETMSLRLKDANGNPVRVLVRGIDSLELSEIMARLPGASPSPDEPPDLERGAMGLLWQQMAPALPRILARSCTPPISFDETVPQGSLPGAWLVQSDQLGLAMKALELSGWFGGAIAAAATFRRLEPGGGAAPAGAPDADLPATVGVVQGGPPVAE
jgi:hypothetical protein